MFAVGTALVLALLPAPGRAWTWEAIGTGGLILWPLFGATNQLLAGLALMVVSFWLLHRGLPKFFAVLPMVFMIVMPFWALSLDVQRWRAGGSWLLVLLGVVLLGITVWMSAEGFLLWRKVRSALSRLPADQESTSGQRL